MYVLSIVLCASIIYNVDGGYESLCCFFFQAEDGIRDLVRSRGLGDVYKRQGQSKPGLNLQNLQDFWVALPQSDLEQRAIATALSLSLIHI